MKNKSLYFFTFNLFSVTLILLFQVLVYYSHHHQFTYPLDDTYIHLAIAKNISEHGVWGLTPYEFSSASSSILYTLLLSFIIHFFGNHFLIPLVINFLFFILLIFSIHYISKKEQFDFKTQSTLSIFIFFSPLPALIISGMEHITQLLIVTWLFYISSNYLQKNDIGLKNQFLWFVIIVLSVAIRYESLFVIAGIFIILFFKKKYFIAIKVLLSALIPVILYGIYSIQQGAYFLPNSLLLKGERPKLSLLGLFEYSHLWLDKLIHTPHLMVLFIVLSTLMIYALVKKETNSRRFYFLSLLLIAFTIHMVLARVGWFYRYEAYLILLSGIVITLYIKELHAFVDSLFKGKLLKFSFWVFLFIIFYPLTCRAIEAIKNISVSMANINDQQMLMSDFISKYYENETIAANDIGAISYYNPIYLVDIFGLANQDIMKLRAAKQYDRKHIQELCEKRNVAIAIIYKEWFSDKIPENWVLCGQFSIENNYICAEKEVYFYAVRPNESNYLSASLKSFSQSQKAVFKLY
ncbi:MAG: hypothetical protein EAZ07_00225 [Cytophagales bacterium]|nr:MAG: hypothetical protein EAZ07_00225 [Cytophagales bacterium]